MSPKKPPESWFWSHDIEPDQIAETLVVPGSHMVRLASYGEGARLRFVNLIYKEPGAPHAWHLGLDAAGLGRKLSESGAHPVSIDAYLDAGGARRFALVTGQGPAPLTSLHADLDEAGVRRLLEDGRRIVDFATYPGAGGRRYAVIVEEHREAASAPSRWWFTGLDARQLDEKALSLGARLWRVRGYTEGGARRYAAAFEKSGGGRWAWYAELDGDAVGRKLEENHAYPVDIDPVREARPVRFNVVMYGE
ncbi:MAG TPA: hypothetical protein VH877_31695 [Polyangia bacterium]|nr:hypothetical protein [Polyangia bacterium]